MEIHTKVYKTYELELNCNKCGGQLEAKQDSDSCPGGYWFDELSVTPCQTCLKDTYKEGYDEGVEDGLVSMVEVPQ